MKITIKQMQEIKTKGLAHIDMRIAKSGNKFIVSYNEESRTKGAKDILLAVTNLYNENLSNVQIIKGDAPVGEYILPVVMVVDSKNQCYIYDDINCEKAIQIYNEHAINNQVVTSLLKAEVPYVK